MADKLEKSDLTEKQKIFCREYIYDWNATRAAKVAGYSEDTAYSIGWENLKKPEIQAYITEIQKDLEKTAIFPAACVSFMIRLNTSPTV
jgi:phage terminase small subunit